MRLVTFVLALAAVSPALAQTPPDYATPPAPAAPKTQEKTQDQVKNDFTMPVQPRGRYSFAPVDEGFLRFDHKSGEVALCKPAAGGWSCQPVADKTAAARQTEQDESEKAIADLRDEVADLKKEIASLRAPPPPPPLPAHPVPPDTVPPSNETGSITLKQDIARARGYIADAWQRLVDMIDRLQKDMRRKASDNGTSRT
jgi:hypothetical protein